MNNIPLDVDKPIKKLKQNFWNDDVRLALTNYILTNDARYFNVVYEAILVIIRIVLNKYGILDDDRLYNMFLYVYERVLPKITIDKVVTSQSFIYKCVDWRVIDMIKKENKINSLEYSKEDYILDTEIDRDIIDKKIMIIHQLDKMIRKQRIINKTDTIFLIELKEYCLENDFDVREFNLYIQKKMNISPMTYSIICSRVKIRSKVLNEPLIKKVYK